MAPRTESTTDSKRRKKLPAQINRQRQEDRTHDEIGKMGTKFADLDGSNERGATFRYSQTRRQNEQSGKWKDGTSTNYGPNKAASSSPKKPKPPKKGKGLTSTMYIGK